MADRIAGPTPIGADLRDRIATVLAEQTLAEANGRRTAVDPATRALVEKIAADRATTLMPMIATALDARWEEGRKHGLRQAHRPGDARARQLEEEIESMLTIEEANSRAWELKCERVRELEAEIPRLQALADRRWVAWQSARARAHLQYQLLCTVEARNYVWIRRALDLEQQLAATTEPSEP